MNFQTLAQMNADHYNNHPIQHNLITVAYAVVSYKVTRKLIKKIVTEKPNPYIVK